MTEVWKPKRKQKKLLLAAQTPGLNRTITALCEEAEINRGTFYKWLEKDEDFKNAWNEVWKWQIDKYMPSVVSAQVKEAQDGSTPAAKYLSELSGKMIKKVEHSGEVVVNKGYEGWNPDELPDAPE